MEFVLPENLATKLISYDQTLKRAIKDNSADKANTVYMKRKVKLAFPCPDIFFDLPYEKIYEIYSELCQRVIPERYAFVYEDENKTIIKYLVTWEKIEDADVWRCWKVGDANCPLILRYWDSFCSDDICHECRADESWVTHQRTVNNPFSYRYKVDRRRREAVNKLLTFTARSVLNYPHLTLSGRGFEKYAYTKFYYERFFDCKNEHEFYPAAWLAKQLLHTSTEDRNDIKTLSQIVNSSFYQNEIRKEAAHIYTEFLETDEPIKTEKIVHKMSYIYMFLRIYPDQYDRSIHLYNQLNQIKFSSNYSTWTVFGRLGSQNNDIPAFVSWLAQRLTPQMFMNWIVEEAERRQKNSFDTPIADTIRMLSRVWCATGYISNPDSELLKEPKRWRLMETHDHYTGIVLQLDNALKNLPMDLIPEPLIFKTELGSITLFQPATNHEVIRWGKAVRNCVGSAGYDERVLKRSAFLVFAELNNKPWLTSLLTLNMGKLSVGQSVSISNKNLTPEETKIYHECLQQALQAASVS